MVNLPNIAIYLYKKYKNEENSKERKSDMNYDKIQKFIAYTPYIIFYRWIIKIIFSGKLNI